MDNNDISVFKVQNRELDEFFPTYVQWSEHRNFPVLHKENVEELFVCSKNGVDIYCCFTWNTNSKMCLVGFPVGNPFVPQEQRRGGLSALFKSVSEFMAQRGYTKVWTTSGTPPVEKALLENGFINADPNVNVYIKPM